ncbi:MAG: hypothetical protein PQJ59_03075 [Spirochaetales bacterium]|nr:hypothetical protein [Spirochaetales bacterium]
MKPQYDSLNGKILECHKHIEKIFVARKNLNSLFPLKMEKYQALDAVAESFIDQLVFRFLKLQDTMGEGIFPRVLSLVLEDIKGKTFLDRLNRLEELDLVDKNQWLELRELRNEIAHEYSDNQEEIMEALNAIFDQSVILVDIFKKIEMFVSKQ